MRPLTVLVTDGEQRAALAIVRSLGRAGYLVHVASAHRRSLAGGSRWCATETVVPDPEADPAAFAGEVEALLSRLGADTLIPVTEASLLALLPLRARLDPVCLPFPDAAAFAAISDKSLVLQRARTVGIAVPEQRIITDRDAAGRLPPDLPFPVVLKPARSVVESNGRRVKLGVRHAAGPAQLAHELAAVDPAAFPVLLQQRVIGPGVGIFLLRWNGRTIASFAHRRIREKPPSGGVSVYRESIAADPELVALSIGLLDTFDWQGVAMIEYKLDEVTGTPYLMEINGRFWGSLQLAIDAGVDFPRLLLDCALGTTPDPVTAYRTGIRSRWWWGDVDHLLSRVRRSSRALNLPPGDPSRLGAVARFLILWRPGDRNEVLRLSDPRPFLRESRAWFRNLHGT